MVFFAFAIFFALNFSLWYMLPSFLLKSLTKTTKKKDKEIRNDYVILEQDERLSSSTAEEILKNQGKKYTKNKALVDAMAASVILNEYIENNR